MSRALTKFFYRSLKDTGTTPCAPNQIHSQVTNSFFHAGRLSLSACRAAAAPTAESASCLTGTLSEIVACVSHCSRVV